MGAFKDSLKKILPPPVNSFMREVNRIVAVEEQNQKLIKQLMETTEKQNQILEQQHSLLKEQQLRLNEQENIIKKQQAEYLKAISEQQMQQTKQFEHLKEKQQCTLNRLEQLKTENNSLKIQTKALEKSMIKQMPQPILEYFVLNILDHCNLRCKGCDHFAAIAEKRFVALEDIENDLARMSELLDGQLIRMGIMGGEPLLHPDLLKILEAARKNFPNTLLQLVTNGLLIMQQPEEFWLTCKENNIVIVNTKYPINLDYEGMIARAKQYGVTFEHYGNTGEVQKTSYKMVLDIKGQQNARNSFIKCYHSNSLPLLMEGKFYPCTVAPNVRHFNKKFGTDIQLTKNDYIDIYQINEKTEILTFLSKPVSFCRYCDVEKRQYGLEWERSKYVKEEWVDI